MVGNLPSGYCLQGVRAEPQIRTKPVTTCEFLEAWGNLSKGRRTVGRSEPEPASAHSLSMSFPLAIPWRVALQQSLPPLRQPPSIVPQPDSNRPESAPRTRPRLHIQGWMPRKPRALRHREECFYLTSPLIELARGVDSSGCNRS